MPKFYLTIILTLGVCQLSAQIRCGTEKYDSLRRQNNSSIETLEQFENWMRLKLQQTQPSNRTHGAQATYTIPVVVHIVHNGQPIGTGVNISDAQVLSQIKVLNNDFQRLNSDAAQTPSEFLPVAGSMSLEFVLAKQDPFGNASTGIVRVNGGEPVWQLYQDTELKSKSYWPAEQYLNIWVTNFPEFLGYTQFPVSNLPGLSGSPDDRLTDGLIIHYRAFGSIDDGAFDLESQYNKGRTLTHEMGHFFGLRHIWGDGASCSATDFVTDTPPQIGSTFNCPTHPVKECSNQSKMFQNYLDYTDDQCMNIFTAGQASRMDIVINNSPRRKNLLTSSGIYPPGNYSLDLGILTVQTPSTLECSGTHTPTVTIRNFGTTLITEVNIELKINNVVFQTNTFNINLDPLSQEQVIFNDYISNPLDVKTFQFNILNVNGTGDDYSPNNSYSIITKTAAQGSTPFFENFESGISNWTGLNPDALIGWKTTALSNGGGNALVMENYYYEIEGAVDKIISPVFDVSSAPKLLLKFKYAHAQYPGVDGEALSVYIIDDCTENLASATRVFFKEGGALATTSIESSFFIPSSEDWVTQVIPLNSFVGTSNLRIAFVNRNGWGNNVYLDDIQLISESVNNITIENILEPSKAVCNDIISPKILVANNGTEDISTLTIVSSNNGANLPNQVLNSSLSPGQSSEIVINNIQLQPGTNSISITINPDGLADGVPGDNTIQTPIGLIQNLATIPVRENFNATPMWSVINTGTDGWVFEETNYSEYAFSAVFKSYSNPSVGDQSWLVSPRLDFSNAIEASLFADFSYRQRGLADEQVILAASVNCGKTFDYTFYADGASTLGDGGSSFSPWVPSAEDEWNQKYFNLNSLAGFSDVLVAFQVTNNNGNNLYLDNIEFFENDDSTPTPVTAPFSVYMESGTTYLTFNLEESQPSRVQVANVMGGILADETMSNALNQTLTFKLGANRAIYIFKIQIGAQTYAVRQYMGN